MNFLPIVGANEVPYLDAANIVAVRTTAPLRVTTKTGYGNKLPTTTMVQLTDKRWRRVYIVCSGNSGTRYVLVNGKPQYLASNFELPFA